ncbi:hypothetical protein EON65_09690 [archaeon]|nr:MAG: hypothetical protein EON65_09690 [archaeon]
MVLGATERWVYVANFGYQHGIAFRKPPFPVPAMHTEVMGLALFTHLVNWKGKVTYDGLMSPLCKAPVSPKKKALKAYFRAYNTHRVTTKLELVPPPALVRPSKRDVPSASRANWIE